MDSNRSATWPVSFSHSKQLSSKGRLRAEGAAMKTIRLLGAAVVAGYGFFINCQIAAAQPPQPAADVRQEIDRLRQDFEALKREYGERIAALEAKLGTESGAAPATPTPPEA